MGRRSSVRRKMKKCVHICRRREKSFLSRCSLPGEAYRKAVKADQTPWIAEQEQIQRQLARYGELETLREHCKKSEADWRQKESQIVQEQHAAQKMEEQRKQTAEQLKQWEGLPLWMEQNRQRLGTVAGAGRNFKRTQRDTARDLRERVRSKTASKTAVRRTSPEKCSGDPL